MQELQINFLPYQFGSDEEGNLWLRSKTLFSNGPEGWGVSEVEDKLQGRNIEVVDKQTMGLKELSEFDDDFITDVMFGEQFMFLSYVNCAYLGVGDQNLRNNLVVGDKSYIIDWEDNSGRKSVEKWSDVFSKSSARLERIISEGMTKYDRKEELQQHIASLPDGGGILKPLLKL